MEDDWKVVISAIGSSNTVVTALWVFPLFPGSSIQSNETKVLGGDKKEQIIINEWRMIPGGDFELLESPGQFS